MEPGRYTVAVIIYVLTPSPDDGVRDIRRYYYANVSWAFSLAAVYLASWSVLSQIVAGGPISEPGSLIRVLDLLLMISLARDDNALMPVIFQWRTPVTRSEGRWRAIPRPQMRPRSRAGTQ